MSFFDWLRKLLSTGKVEQIPQHCSKFSSRAYERGNPKTQFLDNARLRG